MSTEKDIQSFREKLEAVTEWPSLYMFKFITPAEKADEVAAIFPNHEVLKRPSSNGNYISLTIKMMAPSADHIIEKYMETSKVEGIISL